MHKEDPKPIFVVNMILLVLVHAINGYYIPQKKQERITNFIMTVMSTIGLVFLQICKYRSQTAAHVCHSYFPIKNFFINDNNQSRTHDLSLQYYN